MSEKSDQYEDYDITNFAFLSRIGETERERERAIKKFNINPFRTIPTLPYPKSRFHANPSMHEFKSRQRRSGHVIVQLPLSLYFNAVPRNVPFRGS